MRVNLGRDEVHQLAFRPVETGTDRLFDRVPCREPGDGDPGVLGPDGQADDDADAGVVRRSLVAALAIDELVNGQSLGNLLEGDVGEDEHPARHAARRVPSASSKSDVTVGVGAMRTRRATPTTDVNSATPASNPASTPLGLHAGGHDDPRRQREVDAEPRRRVADADVLDGPGQGEPARRCRSRSGTTGPGLRPVQGRQGVDRLRPGGPHAEAGAGPSTRGATAPAPTWPGWSATGRASTAR